MAFGIAKVWQGAVDEMNKNTHLHIRQMAAVGDAMHSLMKMVKPA